MSAVNERSMIGVRFQTGWADRLPVAWPNAAFAPNATQAYVQFSIVQADAEQIEIGGEVSTKRARGRVFLQVFVPEGGGDAVARAHADFAANLFRKPYNQLNTPEGRVIFREPVIRDVGAAKPFYQINVAVPYLYDTI